MTPKSSTSREGSNPDGRRFRAKPSPYIGPEGAARGDQSDRSGFADDADLAGLDPGLQRAGGSDRRPRRGRRGDRGRVTRPSVTWSRSSRLPSGSSNMPVSLTVPLLSSLTPATGTRADGEDRRPRDPGDHPARRKDSRRRARCWRGRRATVETPCWANTRSLRSPRVSPASSFLRCWLRPARGALRSIDVLKAGPHVSVETRCRLAGSG
jgi:hypothetical protein